MAASHPLNQLLASTCEWLRGSGPESDIVLSSRIRLARNLTGYVFSERLDSESQEQLIDEVELAVGGTALLKDSLFIEYKQLKDLDRQFLLERHLISREHAGEKGEKALVITKNEVVSIMILEEIGRAHV